LKNGFAHSDDYENFLNNPNFVGLGWKQVDWAWKTTRIGVYQPISWMCLSAESSLWGLDPKGYHAVSLVLFALNLVILCRLTVLLLSECSTEETDRGLWRVRTAALAATALYAVHPLRVEVVAWVSCQPYLLCSLFGLLSVYAYLMAHGRGTLKYKWPGMAMFGSYVLYWAALLSKAPAISLPLALLILDIYPLRRLGGKNRSWLGSEARHALVEKLPYFALAVPFMYLTRRARYQGPGSLVPMSFSGPFARFSHACYSVWFYPLKSLWPSDLICVYEMPSRLRPTEPAFVIAVLAVVLFSAGLYLMRSRWPGLLAAWAVYLILLAPMSGLIPFGAFIGADRYSYIVAMSWVPPIAVALHWLVRWRLPTTAWLATVGVMGFLSVLIALTQAQTRTWHNAMALYRHALSRQAGRQSAWVHNNLAAILMARGENQEALDHIEEALRIGLYPLGVINRGELLGRLGRVDEGVALFSSWIQRDPNEMLWRIALGRLNLSADRYDEAISSFREAVRLQPIFADAHAWLGYALSRRGDLDEAAVQFSAALKLRPNDPKFLSERDAVLNRLERPSEAASRPTKALHPTPDQMARQGRDETLKSAGAMETMDASATASPP
jgi:tetratricopeptide (TPR) repeat protein